MITKYSEIVKVGDIASRLSKLRNCEDIPSLVQREKNIFSADFDRTRVLMVFIDPQNDFMEGISDLGVPGSKGDIERMTKWLYYNGHKVTRLMVSLDTHTMAQIFHQCWWRDANGNTPAPYTIISYDDLMSNKWIPIYDKRIFDEDKPNRMISYCEKYLEMLEKTGKYKLCIWPYHCLEGTFGANVENQLSRMIYFHSLYRRSQPLFIRKGMDPWSEMYGIIKPEWSNTGYVNTQVLEEMKMYDIVIFVGEAASHCVGQSGLQILEHFKQYPCKSPKFVFFKDCMSPVAGFEEATAQIFKEFEEKYGALVVNSTDFVL